MRSVRAALSGCRDEIKGVAILWVVFFHARLGLSGLAYEVQRIGYGGVDIFFFLSGYGLFRSLSKDAQFVRYLHRRAKRLLPAYLPFCAVWLAVMIPLSRAGLGTAARIAVGNLSMLGFFWNTPLLINWYVSALTLSILMAPLFYAAVKPGRAWRLRGAALVLALFAVGLLFVGSPQYMAVSRLPVFALGMLFAGAQGDETRGRWVRPALYGLGVAGLAALYGCLHRFTDQQLCDTGLYWHPFFFAAPALCVALASGFERCHAAVRRPFALLGDASFEIFLFNAWLEVAGKRFGLARTPAQWALWSAAGIAVGLLYHQGIKLAGKHEKSKKSG